MTALAMATEWDSVCAQGPGRYSQTDMWIDHKAEYGRSLFQKGEFETAMLWYEFVIAQLREVYRVKHVRDTSRLFELLSAHVVCCEKAGCYARGKRTAHKMVNMFPSDPRGYLRRAQIEAVFDTPETALHTYREGLERCVKTCTYYPKLVEHYRKLRANIKSGPISKKRNLIVLPREIQNLILSYLSYKELVKCTRVSRGWQHVILSNRHIQTTVDLTDAYAILKNSNLEALFRKATTPQKLIMYNYPESHEATTRILLKHILKSQTWLHIEFFDLDPDGPFCALLPLLLTCKHEKIDLKDRYETRCKNVDCTARIPWCQNLKVVKDVACYTETEFSRLIMSCPRLEHIQLEEVDPGTYHFPGFDLPEPFSTLPKPPLRFVQVLTHAGSRLDTPPQPGTILQLSSGEPCGYSTALLDFVLDRGAQTLTTLNFGGIKGYFGRNGTGLDFSSLKRLQHLDVREGVFREPIKIPETLESFSAVFSVFDGSTLITTDTPSNAFPALQKLNLKWTTSLEMALFQDLQIGDEDVLFTEWVGRTNLFRQIASTNNGTLKVLYTGDVVSNDELSNIISTGIFKSLTTLIISIKIFDLDDRVLDKLISCMPNLEALDINNSVVGTYVAQRFVKELKLKRFSFRNCPNIGLRVRQLLRNNRIPFLAEHSVHDPDRWNMRYGD